MLVCCFLLGAANSQLFAQVAIGSSSEPNLTPDEDAILDLRSGGNKGLLLPRLKLVDLDDPAPLSKHTAGMTVYNLTGGSLPEGYYFNDGTAWIQLAEAVHAWKSIETQEGTESVTEEMYRTGAVSIGTVELEDHTQFMVASPNKGVLLPRMTDTQMLNITKDLSDSDKAQIDGLMVYNTTINCFSFFNADADEWMSLCAESAAAHMEIECGTDCGAKGTYKALVSLNSDNYYRLQIRVNEPGAYSVRITTENGYSFSRAGEFFEPGIYTIDVAGSGTPSATGTDQVTVYLNGELVDVDLNNVYVNPPSLSYTISCAGEDEGKAWGEYKTSVTPGAGNYIDLIVLTLYAGTGTITTDTINGLYFQTDENITLEEGKRVARLYARGVPTEVGTYDFIVYDGNGGPSGCGFSVDVALGLGTYTNPAQSCLALYDAGVRTDGEYWLTSSENGKIKTLCDMTNGGYTLIWSYSENTAYNTTTLPFGSASSSVVMTRKHQLNQNAPRNQTTAESGSINYADFRMSLNEMKNVRSTSSGTYRVQINYLPTAMMNDLWGQNFHLEVTPNTTSLDFINNEYGATLIRNNFKMDGMYFGLPMVSTGTGSYTYNGQEAKSTVGHWHNDTYYATHIDVGYAIFSTDIDLNTTLYKHPDDGGSSYSYTVNTNHLNNLFGWFGESEADHSFGKCGSDNYINQGTASHGCTGSSKTVHTFNNGEGRYLQWWVK